MLSVFRTAKFHIDAASAIRGKKWEKANTCLDLLHLKSRHLVEMALDDFSKERSKFYCLQPLVVQFLLKKSKNEEESNTLLEVAKNCFIEHFGNVVSALSLDFHTHPAESQKISSKTNLIFNFFSDIS